MAEGLYAIVVRIFYDTLLHMNLQTSALPQPVICEVKKYGVAKTPTNEELRTVCTY